MKKGTIIALIVVILLAVAYFATKQEPVRKIKAPYSIPAIEKLARVEITHPGDKGELVVLQKKDAEWWLQKPVEAPVEARHAEQLDKVFAKKIGSDDLPIAQDDPASFDLGDDKAVKVAVFAEGAESPTAEFSVGKPFVVAETRAKRTFIKGSDGKIYRAHTDAADLLRKDSSELRSRRIQQMDRTAIKHIKITYADGPAFTFKNDTDKWALREPEIEGLELEPGQVSGLVSNLANLVAKSFVDDKKPEDVGLDKPFAQIAARAGEDVQRLNVSKDDAGRYYVSKPDQNFIWEVSEGTGKLLTPTITSLRKRIVHELDKDAITRVDFAGPERFSIVKDAETWKPAKGKDALKQVEVTTRLNSLARLRATDFAEVSLADAGLDKSKDTAVLHTADAKFTLVLGNDAPTQGNVYARWQDSDLVMIVPAWVRERATAKLADLVESGS